MQPREIDDGEYVSQYGSRQTGKAFFWDRPRPRDFDGLSVMIGRLTPEEARQPVRRDGMASHLDGVRYAKVGDLRALGMEVVHTPSRANPDHVSVRRAGEWGDEVAGRFNECFEGPQWYEEPEGGDDG
jgi:hypothetical protein